MNLRRKQLLSLTIGMLTGITSYGCWIQGKKYFLVKERWKRLDYFIDNFNPLDLNELEM